MKRKYVNATTAPNSVLQCSDIHFMSLGICIFTFSSNDEASEVCSPLSEHTFVVGKRSLEFGYFYSLFFFLKPKNEKDRRVTPVMFCL